jgi:hypothetical protein
MLIPCSQIQSLPRAYPSILKSGIEIIAKVDLPQCYIYGFCVACLSEPAVLSTRRAACSNCYMRISDPITTVQDEHICHILTSVARISLATGRWLSEKCRSAAVVLGNHPISVGQGGFVSHAFSVLKSCLFDIDHDDRTCGP